MKLHVSKNGHLISEYEFPADLGVKHIVIGRSQASHIMIDDPMVSRSHIELIFDSGQWSAVKKTEFGEMSHNGKDIQKANLQNQDILEIGPYSIQFLEVDQPNETTFSNFKLETESEKESPSFDDDNTNSESESLDEVESDEAKSDYSEPEENNDDFGNQDFDSDNDFNFDDEDDGFEGVGDKTGVFTNFANFYLRIFGENVPYDRYIIPEGEIYIGRKSDKCQIVLTEDDVSSVHAVIKRNKVSCYLEDLNSANGTLLNGERVNKSELVNGDEFVIGSTTFTVEVTSDLLREEKDRLMPVEPNQEIDVEEYVEEAVDFGDFNEEGASPTPGAGSKSIFKNPEKRKRLLIGLVVLLGIWAVLDDGGGSSSGPKKKQDQKTAEQKPGEANQNSNDPNAAPKKVLSQEQKEVLEASYQVGVRYFEENNFAEARDEFTKVVNIDPTYRNIETYIQATDKALIELNKAEERRRDEEKRRILEAEVKGLLEKAQEAFKDKNIELTQFYMNKVAEKDPENLELPYLRVEVDTYLKKKREEEERRRREKEARDKMLAEMKPGETFFYKREWYKAILKLEAFTRLKDIDNDLIEKAADMIERARRNLRDEVEPLLGEARSLREGQDLKGAYELYSKIYQLDQSNTAVLNEMEEIRQRLEKRSMKVYREALIAESLSLFDEAKEKFQEVQQISPSDSQYYKKASDKLKNYFE